MIGVKRKIGVIGIKQYLLTVSLIVISKSVRNLIIRASGILEIEEM